MTTTASCFDAAHVAVAEAAIELHGSVVEEAVLLQGPVRGVRARLAELLAEWPDHPLLTQLAAIADRLLGEPRVNDGDRGPATHESLRRVALACLDDGTCCDVLL